MIRSRERGAVRGEEPLEGIGELIGARKKNGTVGTIRAVLVNIHERGIRAAGKRSLPLYAFVAMIVLSLATVVAGALGAAGGATGALGQLLLVALLLVLLGLWFGMPVVVYWDCKAAERYANQNWRLGKVLAAACILTPGFVVFHLAYRGWKL